MIYKLLLSIFFSALVFLLDMIYICAEYYLRFLMAEHNELGQAGERLAVEYILSIGYTLRHCNWVCGKKEIDIVAVDGDELVIIEVKTRSTDFFEHPKEAITNSKIRNLVAAAEEYIFEFDILMETRFDIVAVVPEGNGSYRIEHVKDAFLPPV